MSCSVGGEATRFTRTGEGGLSVWGVAAKGLGAPEGVSGTGVLGDRAIWIIFSVAGLFCANAQKDARCHEMEQQDSD